MSYDMHMKIDGRLRKQGVELIYGHKPLRDSVRDARRVEHRGMEVDALSWTCGTNLI
jgi:hypothetical protein